MWIVNEMKMKVVGTITDGVGFYPNEIIIMQSVSCRYYCLACCSCVMCRHDCAASTTPFLGQQMQTNENPPRIRIVQLS